jgi:endogenous inhibitor of DNA gyrase (YacG/DUF329 family)
MNTKQRQGKCPICGEPTDSHYRPFCSRRCADVDLHRWLSGTYAIAGTEDTEAAADDRSDAASTSHSSKVETDG